MINFDNESKKKDDIQKLFLFNDMLLIAKQNEKDKSRLEPIMHRNLNEVFMTPIDAENKTLTYGGILILFFLFPSWKLKSKKKKGEYKSGVSFTVKSEGTKISIGFKEEETRKK